MWLKQYEIVVVDCLMYLFVLEEELLDLHPSCLTAYYGSYCCQNDAFA